MRPLQTPHPVVALRSMRGYSDTKPDGNPARSAQPLRRQFGEIYALNLDRNTYRQPTFSAQPSV
jgi:hypothetical protein